MRSLKYVGRTIIAVITEFFITMHSSDKTMTLEEIPEGVGEVEPEEMYQECDNEHHRPDRYADTI